MGKAVGSEPLGSLYSAGKVRRRREWRGLRDTMYDYFRWLGILGVLLRFIAKPRNFRGFLRYRWMVNYLAVPMMIRGYHQILTTYFHQSVNFVFPTN